MSDPSIGGAVIGIVRASALVATRVWRSDKMPERPKTFPYVTVLDMISDAPGLSGDCETMARFRLVQVDVWQRTKDEDFLLCERLVDMLDGTAVVAAQRAWRVKVVDAQRLDDPDEQIIHHALTLRIAHRQPVVAA
jgi:hypothetical protein